MRELPIKRKRDWGIAFVFTALIVYCISNYFSSKMQQFLLKIGDFRMTNMNQPQSFGNVIVTVLAMTFLTTIVLWIQKKSFRLKLAVLCGGILLAAAILGGYFFYCGLIISAADTEEPVQISFSGWGSETLELTEEQEQKITEYCAALEPIEKERQEALKERFYQRQEDSPISENIHIWISYPRKYGHQYDLIVYVYEDMIYILKEYGNDGRMMATFCLDNGLLEMIEEIMK